MTRLLTPLVVLVSLLLVGCDSAAPDEPLPQRSMAGMWVGSVEHPRPRSTGRDWTGQLSLDLQQSGDRPFGRGTWTDGTVTLRAWVGGYAPSSGPIRLSLDHVSEGTIVYLLELDGNTLSGTWTSGSGSAVQGTARLVRQ